MSTEKLLDLFIEYLESNKDWEIKSVGIAKEEGEITKFAVSCKDNGYTTEKYISIYEVLSKKFGFIKWLFDEDKIDWSKFHKYSFYKKDNKFIQYYDCESLLMALSIQDNPIEFLVSILK